MVGILSSFASLPVTLGPVRAAQLACWIMLAPQVIVTALLLWLDRPFHSIAVGVIILAQIAAMRILLRDPKGRAPWYNATGVVLYISGMMIAAFAVRGI